MATWPEVNKALDELKDTAKMYGFRVTCSTLNSQNKKAYRLYDRYGNLSGEYITGQHPGSEEQMRAIEHIGAELTKLVEEG
jgi:hypothetical protein